MLVYRFDLDKNIHTIEVILYHLVKSPHLAFNTGEPFEARVAVSFAVLIHNLIIL